MKPECKYNVEHSFQTIHLSPKTQITVYTHRRTDDMKIPDTVQYQVITLQKLSEHCFHITQRVHKHTTRQINVYYWQNILSHADISKRVWEYSDDPEMYIHDQYTDICDLSSAGEREPPSYSGPISALTFTISMEHNTKYHTNENIKPLHDINVWIKIFSREIRMAKMHISLKWHYLKHKTSIYAHMYIVCQSD